MKKYLLITVVLCFCFFNSNICLSEKLFSFYSPIILTPGKSLGDFYIGEDYNLVVNKLAKYKKHINVETQKDKKMLLIAIAGDRIIEIGFKNNKVTYISRPKPANAIIYNNYYLKTAKTDFNKIKKLFPGGKIKAYKSEESLFLVYSFNSKGFSITFEPISNFFILKDVGLRGLKYTKETEICKQEKYKTKLYKCYVFSGIMVYKPGHPDLTIPLNTEP